MDDSGLVTLPCEASVRETIDRLASIVTEKGLTVFARIDHADNARNVGAQLRPTELLIFGNPRAGTPLMQASQTAGLDLPVKALAWQDEDGKVWLTYNDARWMASRHQITTAQDTLTAIENGMRFVCGHAAQRSA